MGGRCMNRQEQLMRQWSKKQQYLLSLFPSRAAQTATEPGLIWTPGSIDTNNLYLYGDPGSGKTCTAIRYVLQFAYNVFFGIDQSKYLQKDCNGFEYNPRRNFTYEFVQVTEFLLLVKDSYRKDSQDSELAFLSKLASVDVLIIDDLGTQRTTDWNYDLLYYLIDQRYNSTEKRTIFTSNFDLEELSNKLGDTRITRRISQMAEVSKIKLKIN